MFSLFYNYRQYHINKNKKKKPRKPLVIVTVLYFTNVILRRECKIYHK